MMVEESTRAALADILTHQFREKKERKESKKETPPALPTVKEIEEAFALYFDGAYRRKEGKAAAGLVIFNPVHEKIMEKGVVLEDPVSVASYDLASADVTAVFAPTCPLRKNAIARLESSSYFRGS